MRWHRRGTAVMSVAILALGLALVVRSLVAAAWAGVAIGLLFVAVGAGRLYLLRR